VTLLANPQYRIGSDQPGGSHRYMLFGVYPGYLVGTGGAGDVHTAMVSLETLLGAGQIEVLKWSGSLGSLSCGAPFSNSGYDGTLNALNGCPQHIVLGLPLVEGSNTVSGCTITAGQSTFTTTTTLNSPSQYVGMDLTGPNIPSRAYVSAATSNSITMKSYATGNLLNATTSTTSGKTDTVTLAWRLHHTTSGQFDAKFTAIATSIVARGYTKLNMTIALGWEMDGSWPWGTKTFDQSTGANQTGAQFAAAFQHAVTVMRAVSGFNCRFEWNTNWQNVSGTPPGYPGHAYTDVIGWDAYNSISNAYSSTNTTGYTRTDFARLFAGELKPAFDKIRQFAEGNDAARAGLGLEPQLVGHSECGVIVLPDSQSGASSYPYHSADTALYWSSLHGYWALYPQRFAYAIFFNQNQGTGGATVTEDSQLWYSVSSGSLSGQSLTTLHNTSTHGPWVNTNSTYHTLSAADYAATMQAGTVQVQDTAVPATTVGYTSKAHNIQLVFA
jgi:hypothetical protein